MATSGTATFNLDITELIEEAFERAGSEVRTGYDYRTARRSLNLLSIGWANRGINLCTVEQGTIALVAGTATYNLPADTVDLLEMTIRTTTAGQNTDINISRISVSTYSNIPNKGNTGRPVQAYINRTATPTVTLWPVPDSMTPYTFVYYRMRRIQDAGTDGSLNFDSPFRFLPALTAGLAYYIAMKKPGLEPRLPILKADYEEAWMNASSEDRERASWFCVPQMYR